MSGSTFQQKFWRWVYEGVRVGEIRGIGIKLHFALILLIAIWLLSSLLGPDPLWSGAQVLIFAGVLFGSVLAHELGHCWGASRVGGESREIVLWPLGGLALTTGADVSAFNEFFITLTGPLVSLALGAFFAAVVALLPDALYASTAGSAVAFTLHQLRDVNLMLFAFNMLVPLFPMDAARLVRSLFSMRFSPEKVTYNLCLGGFFVAGILVCLYFVAAFGQPSFFARSASFMLLFVAAFGIQSCIFEMRRIEHSYVYGNPFPQGPPYRELGPRTMRAFGFAGPGARIVSIHDDPRDAARPLRAKLKASKREADRPLTERDRLQQQLDEAVRLEDFGRAAEIRDKLRSLAAGSPGA